MHYLYAKDFAQWRAQARDMLARGLTPLDVAWEASEQQSFFTATLPPAPSSTIEINVPKTFLALAKTIACHRSDKRWDLLYQLLFRLHCGEKNLMHIPTDPLMYALLRMHKAIRRDAHKMKAFVRFKKIEDESGEHYIAWHEPDHRVTPMVAPFFSRRFSSMRWAVITPDDSAYWDGETLDYGPGLTRDAAPSGDALDALWRDYYRATFNPARIKLKMMKSEMPVRYWKNLPETKIIASMLAEAPERVEAMLAHTQAMPDSAESFLPVLRDLAHLREASKGCEGCELHRQATQTVFGEGPENARLMLIGEQPGDEEDKTGHPFTGPAGQLLDEALTFAGIRREEVYITNAVKHFRFLYKDSFRQHQSPSRYHIQACKPWLIGEIAAIKPQLIVCLGNSAARSLLGSGFTMKNGRGILHPHLPPVLATYHPAAILRAPAQERASLRTFMFDDIQHAARNINADSGNNKHRFGIE